MMLEEDSVEDQARVIIKRQAANTDGCVIYRYGSFSTEIEIIGQIWFMFYILCGVLEFLFDKWCMLTFSEGIESVQIVRVAVAEGFLLTEMERNIVDFTVTCQGRWESIRPEWNVHFYKVKILHVKLHLTRV